MTKTSTCNKCQREFGIFYWRQECSKCKNIFCSDCVDRVIGIKGKTCLRCQGVWYINKCDRCQIEFGYSRDKIKCIECEKVLCSKCVGFLDYVDRYVCNHCQGLLNTKVNSVKEVQSNHIGGHDIIQKYNRVESQFASTNRQLVINNIKYQAAITGANAIVSLNIEKITRSRPTGRDNQGTYYYSEFKASGIPAKVQKKKFEKSKKKNIAQEIEKLAALKERGLLTDEEFAKAKSQFI